LCGSGRLLAAVMLYYRWCLQRLQRRWLQKASEAYFEDLKHGGEMIFDSLKRGGALPPDTQMSLTVSDVPHPEWKDRAKQDAEFLKSLKIKP
jgi:hypothetical protein